MIFLVQKEDGQKTTARDSRCQPPPNLKGASMEPPRSRHASEKRMNELSTGGVDMRPEKVASFLGAAANFQMTSNTNAALESARMNASDNET